MGTKVKGNRSKRCGEQKYGIRGICKKSERDFDIASSKVL